MTHCRYCFPYKTMKPDDKHFLAMVRLQEGKAHIEEASRLLEEGMTIGATKLLRAAIQRLADAGEEIAIVALRSGT